MVFVVSGIKIRARVSITLAQSENLEPRTGSSPRSPRRNES